MMRPLHHQEQLRGTCLLVDREPQGRHVCHAAVQSQAQLHQGIRHLSDRVVELGMLLLLPSKITLLDCMPKQYIQSVNRVHQLHPDTPALQQ